jgi:hypothetical protein
MIAGAVALVLSLIWMAMARRRLPERDRYDYRDYRTR